MKLKKIQSIFKKCLVSLLSCGMAVTMLSTNMVFADNISLEDDTIVLDYGLPVEVDVLANDTVPDGATLTLVNDEDNSTGEVDSDGKFTGTYGDAEVTNNKIIYTLNHDFCGIETITYSVEGTTDTATLTVIPATSVYYEEDFSATYGRDDSGNLTMSGNFVSIKTTKGVFSTVSDDNTYGTYQETGFVGTTDDSTYGTDAVYLSNFCDSYGTSLKVDTTNGAAQYTYSFTGTGTTIYGRVNTNTGYIRVTVTDSSGDVVNTEYIDTIKLVATYYDEETEKDEQILDSTLYNVPIYQETALESDYDTYTVKIYVYKVGKLHDDNSDFYLDGIRVFNPMGESWEQKVYNEETESYETVIRYDNVGYPIAKAAYEADGEANTAIVNIRDKVVLDYEEGYADNVFTLTDTDGAIDDVYDYNEIGPNQEFYLKEGYELTFALVGWNRDDYKIYLGLKTPNGITSSVKVGSRTISVGNSADCYYDITDCVEVETLKDGTVVGYVNIEGKNGLTALTNIKVTGANKFDLAYNEDVNVTSLTTATLNMVSTAYAASLTAEDEEETVTYFEPSSITNSCSYASKTEKATVNVVTSKDVASVTINGEEISAKTVSGKYRYTKSYTNVASGTTYEIIAYDSDGNRSETYTVTAE
ncbi:MAG: hypothetical protein LUG46_06500 [Erysipelotrichaceae bacterium]|nr:hypothetical protein [Erysipelotrichaceae bacterium]